MSTNLYHVTGVYSFGNDISGHYVNEHSIELDVLVLADDECGAIDEAIRQSMTIVPEWDDDEGVKVAVAAGDAMAEYERKQAEQFSRLHSQPLFPLAEVQP